MGCCACACSAAGKAPEAGAAAVTDGKPAALITGSSRGVGAALAKLLAGKGWNLVLNCSSSAEQARAVQAECQRLGSQAMLVIGDVGRDDTCRQMAAAAEDSFGRIDGLVNNAATTKFCALNNMDGLNEDDFLNIYRVNVLGPFQMIRAALPALRRSGGSVVNVASTAGLSGIGSSAAYAASKGALLTLTRSLARALGPVRVNAVCPGFIQGDWLRGGLGDAVYEAVLARVEKNAPLGLACTPEQVAENIYYLLAQASVVSGEALILDGGAHLPPALLD